MMNNTTKQITSSELSIILGALNPSSSFITMESFAVSGDSDFFKGVGGSRKAADKRDHDIIPYRSYTAIVGSDYVTKIVNSIEKADDELDDVFGTVAKRKEYIRESLEGQVESGIYTKVSNVLYIDNRTGEQLVRFYTPKNPKDAEQFKSETLGYFNSDLATKLNEETQVLPYKKPFVAQKPTTKKVVVNGVEKEFELPFNVRGIKLSSIRKMSIAGETYEIVG